MLSNPSMLPSSAAVASKLPVRFTSSSLRVWSNVDIARLFPDFFTVWCVLVFLGPCVKSLYYTHDISVVYWMGSMPGFMSALAVFFLAIGAVMHWLTQVPSKVAIIISMVGAGLTLAVTADGLVMHSYELRDILVASDCRWSEKKYELEKAWQAASVFFQECRTASTNRTTTFEAIAACPGYSAMLTKYSKSWGYLAELEEMYACAGWCSPSAPLWSRYYKVDVAMRDSCSAVVAEILTAKVIPFTMQVTVFGMVESALTVVFLVLMGGSMRHLGARC